MPNTLTYPTTTLPLPTDYADTDPHTADTELTIPDGTVLLSEAEKDKLLTIYEELRELGTAVVNQSAVYELLHIVSEPDTPPIYVITCAHLHDFEPSVIDAIRQAVLGKVERQYALRCETLESARGAFLSLQGDILLTAR